MSMSMTTTERRKPGRKPKPPSERLAWRSVRLHPETLAAIERTAQARGVTGAQIIREALTDWLKQEAREG